MPDSNTRISTTKMYHCYWSEDYHHDFFGTIDMILRKFKDLDPNEEEWFAWDFAIDATDGRHQYLTGGGVTINEFHRDSELFDKIECDNMTIKRVA